MTTYFITAIDTEVGKTIATGLLAHHIAKQQNVITMKVAQTGCDEFSEDIQKHRELMTINWKDVDEKGLTCPYVFSYPASPHLSAQLEGRIINTDNIEASLQQLNTLYDTVFLEGVGGVMVPLTEELLLIDWLSTMNLPVLLVTSGKLGSINHTLLTLEALKYRNIELYGLIYNNYQNGDNKIINNNTRDFLKNYTKNKFSNCHWGEIFDTNKPCSGTSLELDDGWFNT